MTCHAAIDIGSNSVKVLVGAIGPAGTIEVAHEEAVVTRLSEGVDGAGRIGAQPFARTLDALRRFVETCRAHGVARIAAVGTRVLRDAANAADFLAACRDLGLEVEIISGETEAEVVRLAAVRELPGVDDSAVVIDIGGGSTEIVWATGGESTELGVVRLTERHVHDDPPGRATLARLEEVVDARLAALPGLPAAAGALVGSSATCSLLARLDLRLDAHDPARIHGHRLTRPTLDAQCALLADLTVEQRKAIRGMDPGRADVLLAGAVVLARTARAVGVDALRVNDRGTRYGVFHRAFGPPG